ncbi:MAG: septal ring lytic transglycosylase RlpA family protein, partial [Tolumonas sp.]|nr:septal ring lytic transglycosylase RlpA family protein [Tolumonas sp.]
MVIKPISVIWFLFSLLLLAACSSQQSERYSYTPTPKPKKPLVDVNGAVPRFEPPSRIGNTDYEVLGREYKVWNGIQQYNTEGTASWYGPGFHGKYTSNGELYNQEDISAAHKNLPLPSYLRVTNLDNGRRLIVRVNDRGPFHGDRILDLS